jgi:hypothetical protein
MNISPLPTFSGHVSTRITAHPAAPLGYASARQRQHLSLSCGATS